MSQITYPCACAYKYSTVNKKEGVVSRFKRRNTRGDKEFPGIHDSERSKSKLTITMSEDNLDEPRSTEVTKDRTEDEASEYGSRNFCRQDL